MLKLIFCAECGMYLFYVFVCTTDIFDWTVNSLSLILYCIVDNVEIKECRVAYTMVGMRFVLKIYYCKEAPEGSDNFMKISQNHYDKKHCFFFTF